MSDQKPRKKQRREASHQENDGPRILLLGSLLPTLVGSGFLGIAELGRLAQTSRGMKAAVLDDSVWAPVYHQKHRSFGFAFTVPKQIADDLGYRCLVRRMGYKEMPKPPRAAFHPLLPPSHDEHDLVMFGNVNFSWCSLGFSITGERLRPFFTEGKVRIRLAEMTNFNCLLSCMLSEKWDFHELFEDEWWTWRLKGCIGWMVNLLRPSDMKTYCIRHYYDIEYEEPLIFRDSLQARSIMERIDYDLVIASGIKNFLWENHQYAYGLSLEAKKEAKTFDEEEGRSDDFYDESYYSNHGLTIAHILSELNFSEDDSVGNNDSVD